MSKLSNTLTMLTLLQTGRKYSIQELANALEVSERMIIIVFIHRLTKKV